MTNPPRQAALLTATFDAWVLCDNSGHDRTPLADMYSHCRDHPTRWLDMPAMCWNPRAYPSLIRGVYWPLRQEGTPISAEQHFRGSVAAHRSRLDVLAQRLTPWGWI